MRVYERSLAFLFAAVLLMPQLHGQQPTIRTTVPLATVPASITDRHGIIYDLGPSDFLLLDNGKPRPVRVDNVDSGLAPVALVTLIQTSDITLSVLAKIRKVGVMIPEAVVGANGEAAVVTFDKQVQLVQDFTTDADAVSQTFRNLKPADNMGGRMIDAVAKALDVLMNRPGPRRANILIIGESKDRGSEEKLPDLIPKIQRTGVTIYSLTYSAYLTPFTTKSDDYQPSGGGLLQAITETARLGKENTAKTLINITGGKSFRFETKSKLENELIRLGTDIHSRYLLSFTPDQESPPQFHHLQLQVKSHPDALIRVRPGYWGVSTDTNQ